MKYNILLFLLLFSGKAIFSQVLPENKNLYDSISKHIRQRNFSKIKSFLNNNKKKFNKNDKYLIIDINDFYYHYLKKNYDNCYIVLNRIEKYKDKLNYENLNQYFTSKGYLFKAENKIDSATIYFTKSLSFFEKDKIKYSSELANIYQGLATIYRLSNNTSKELKYLNDYLEIAKKTGNEYKISSAYNSLGVYYDKNNNPKNSLENFKKSLNYKQRNISRNTTLQNIGSIYLKYFNNVDSAFYYNQKAINEYTSKRNLAFIHYDLSLIASRKNNLNQENKELQTSLKYIKLDPFPELEIKLYKDLSENNKKLKNYKESLRFLEKYDSLNNVVKNQSLIEKVEEIEIKYQSEKKEKENLQLKIEKEKTNNFLIASLLFIFLSSIITVLIFKNSNKKRKVAEQQKELETQKNLTLLKEQEITTINAMVDGQEKERKQIAEDLHDNLGSVLATLKLHFEKLKINCEKNLIDPEILFNKTENLIDEAYIKVRSIAHAKNSGVIANQGLLVAIKLMADKISSADNIKIDVIDFGLNKRLKNSLEITVFRIIQELITNIIKHAEAKNATINISLYDKNLNIIIEDDGKGFNFKKGNLKKGMGINSIETRVAHLEGTFEIDSTLGKGSSIIINIPIS
ncbi:hypothetical protein SAMN05216503_1839 [Polaribacter sp. KT25b]|uniref:tetratricopeptide repeat-containing sensor histidine kinase n=1 Tax=Polaribacter sp. KT25b TaxID=1855336 RepID=UPI00087C986C|nr:tetratricopeptide repeat-containing sensor histidine kinase [Polaribacter sp. KT25b]SDS05687.1 hypothetical protein SAMN05216503_1839 [Polaribacter sp. KT25b]